MLLYNWNMKSMTCGECEIKKKKKMVFGRCRNKEPHSSGILLRRVVVVGYEKEPFPRSQFTPGSIWTYWMLINRQMQSDFTSELHRWTSKLTARHLQILHQEIFWSPW